MVESAREVRGSVRVGGKRNEATWKRVLAGSNEETKEKCMEAYRGE